MGLGPPTTPASAEGILNVIVDRAGRLRLALIAQLVIFHPSGEELVHARSLGDTKSDIVSDASGARPAPAAGGTDHAKEVRLRYHGGRLRPPAYILIALVIALVAILLLIAGVMLAPG